MAGRGTDIILGGNPEYAAWEQLRHTYDSRLDVPKDEWDGLIAEHPRGGGHENPGEGDRRQRRSARHRHRTARLSPDRQPAPRPGRPAGRPRFVAFLRLPRRPPDAGLRRRVRPAGAGHGGNERGRVYRVENGLPPDRGRPEEGRGTPLRPAEKPPRIRRGDGRPAEAGLSLSTGYSRGGQLPGHHTRDDPPAGGPSGRPLLRPPVSVADRRGDRPQRLRPGPRPGPRRRAPRWSN